MEPKRNKNYIAGIYLRLSRDDERAGESLSIENQKILVTKYVKEKRLGDKRRICRRRLFGNEFRSPRSKAVA